MFNQNDKAVNGNGYTVVFTDDNKKEANAAQIKYDNAVSPIKIERLQLVLMSQLLMLLRL